MKVFRGIICLICIKSMKLMLFFYLASADRTILISQSQHILSANSKYESSVSEGPLWQLVRTEGLLSLGSYW